MKVLYMANVGTRDLTWKGQLLTPCRLESEKLLQRYDEVRGELDAPILAPGLTRVVARAGRVDRLILFASDQPESTPAKYRDCDTLNAAKVLKAYLLGRFAERLGAIEVENVALNPADYNAMFGYFAQRLPQVLPAEAADVVYVAPVGGADASNAGLWVNAVRLYGRRLQLLYVTPEGSVHQLDLGAELLREGLRRQAAAHLAAHDYAALERLLGAEPDFAPAWAAGLAAYAHHRLRFDFERADSALAEALRWAVGDVRAAVTALRESLAAFPPLSPAPTSPSAPAEWESWLDLQRRFLAELMVHLQMKIEQEEWLEFLGRLFRLHEALLRLAFESHARHSTEGNDREGYPDFARALAVEPQLLAHLQEKKVSGDRPTTRALAMAVDFWVRHAGQGDKFGPVLRAAEHLERLSALRNKSAIAHGYGAVGRDQIEAIVLIAVLTESLGKAAAALGAAPAGSDFDRVDALLRDAMGAPAAAAP